MLVVTFLLTIFFRSHSIFLLTDAKLCNNMSCKYFIINDAASLEKKLTGCAKNLISSPIIKTISAPKLMQAPEKPCNIELQVIINVCPPQHKVSAVELVHSLLNIAHSSFPLEHEALILVVRKSGSRQVFSSHSLVIRVREITNKAP